MQTRESEKERRAEEKKATLALSFLFNEKTYLTEEVYFDVLLTLLRNEYHRILS